MEPCDSCTDFVRHRIQYQSHGCVQLEEKRLHKLTVLVHLYGISDSFEFLFFFFSVIPTAHVQHALLQKAFTILNNKKKAVFSRISITISDRHRPQADKKGVRR